MNRSAIIRPAAQAEIDQQADYLAEHASLEIAVRFLDAVCETIHSIIDSPNIGSPWISDHPRLQNIRKHKVIGFPNHLLFYINSAKTVEVLHLFHGKQDIDSRLSDEVNNLP